MPRSKVIVTKVATEAPPKPKKVARKRQKPPEVRETEQVEVACLKDHPRNYRQHPDDQLAHIEASIREHGFYRNIVVAKDNTILAGHGVVKTARKMGLKVVPVVRLDLEPDDPLALKVVAGDNEIGHLAEVDDRALSEMLKEVMESVDLLGTGFDASMLAAHMMVTRPASEVRDLNAAGEWVGMPAYEEGSNSPKIIITFKTADDRERFRQQAGLKIDKVAGLAWSTRWPFTEREDSSSIRFEVVE